MSSYGHLHFSITNSSGLPVSGASVEVRSQGASINGDQSGTSPKTFNVTGIGALQAADVVSVNAGSTQYTVDSVTSSSVTLSNFSGTLALLDDDRITIRSNLPALSNDANGFEAISNPLTTNSLGQADCWLASAPRDYLVSGGGITTTLYQDAYPEGIERAVSNIFDGAGIVAWLFDTLRSLVNATAKLIEVRTAGAAQWTLYASGAVTQSGAHTVSSGGQAVTGAITGSTTITAATGITSTAGNVQATAGDLVGRRVVANKGTTVVAGNFALSAGWGNTATITFGPAGKENRGQMGITANGAGIAANPQITFTFPDGAFADVPYFVVCRRDRTAPDTGYWRIASATTTLSIWEFVGLPVAGSEYTVSWVGLG